MRLHRFFNVVPRAVRIAACAIVCCAVLIGVVVGITQGRVQNAPPPALGGLFGMGMGLLAGTFAALWILCLGYVYADARRRAMPTVLWTLLAALVPNLLGFLFYFALRKPILSQCSRCGRVVEVGQRFCPSCGLEQFSSAESSGQFAYASTAPVTQGPPADSGAETPH
ncbi:MAG TPA: PLDc N-terminal domain-containing protein [Acidobacteriaceae bacterium]